MPKYTIKRSNLIVKISKRTLYSVYINTKRQKYKDMKIWRVKYVYQKI